MRPLVIVDNFLALVDQCPAHIEELFPCQCVLSVVYRAGCVLDARHLEQFVRMRRNTGAGQALLVDRDWTSLYGSTLLASDAVNRETVQDLIDFSLIVCRSEIAL